MIPMNCPDLPLNRIHVSSMGTPPLAAVGGTADAH
jgi:hypothetical protein